MTTDAAPQVVVIAGPNGAGKTSSAPDLLHDTIGIDTFVNADVIAQGLAGFDPASAAFEAGRIMLRRLGDLARSRVNFAFESTLAGRSTYALLTDLIERGYDVHIHYLWLPSAPGGSRRTRRARAGDSPTILERPWQLLPPLSTHCYHVAAL